MFKAKLEDTNMNSAPLKASVAKTLRAKVADTYPNCKDYLDEIWPKKAKVMTLKLKGDNHLSFIKIDEEVVFMELRDKPILPMLRTLHKYPNMMTPMQCDKGAIKHIFSGSNIMAPGLTSEGGSVVPDLPRMAPVAITAEGKQHAMAIGVLSMSSCSEISKELTSVFKDQAKVHVETADYVIILKEEQRVAFRGEVLKKTNEADWQLTPQDESPYKHHMLFTVQNQDAPENDG